MKLLLSFDIEEFDMPLEYKGKIAFDEQVKISRNGLITILNLLEKHQIKATFFTTVIFAENNQDLIIKLLQQGHELASHTWFHSEFKTEHLRASKLFLEDKFKTKVTGLRMPRLMEINNEDAKSAGYTYNSSLNPTYLPGRYNNFTKPRKPFIDKGIYQVPASVSPIFRLPLFWLSFHNFPYNYYKFLAKRTVIKDGILTLYFHPWEFEDIKNPDFNLPGFTTKNIGKQMVKRFDDFLSWINSSKIETDTMNSYVENLSK